MTDEQFNAWLAAHEMIGFYLDATRALDRLYRSEAIDRTRYRSERAALDVSRIQWEERARALEEGWSPITGPTEAQVAELSSAIESLGRSVAASNAVDGLLGTIADAATTARSLAAGPAA